jgi:hypothetical protein
MRGQAFYLAPLSTLGIGGLISAMIVEIELEVNPVNFKDSFITVAQNTTIAAVDFRNWP